ncbi:unnamed protein product [Heligmosomoides polygyrus]|uniref:Small ribosomal subunit protein eS25 n=1 Tax=Heligmosomoides polygyrus TaxID=6339 RepID=A0A3P7Y9P7_HELPZ|nr:unnamed protein product [Heligmosomoides polygyrus]
MSLIIPADGILQTNLQWEDLQESVYEAFGPEAKLGPNKGVKDIGLGNGFLSKICLISPDWQNGGAEGLPEKFVVKVHNTEVYLYRLLKKYGVTNIARPTVYYSREFSAENPLKGYIIMEYIAGGLPIHIFNNLEPELVLQPLKSIARLEAASLKFSDEDRSKFLVNPFKDLFSTFLTKESVASVFTMLRSLNGERMKSSIDNLEAVVSEILDPTFADNLPEKLGMKRVLCHGDVWTTNLIWRTGEKGEVELAAMVDFQTAHFGCPSTDVVRVICACLSGKDRRENWEWLVEKFYSFLEEEVGDHEMPYTLSQLKQAYRSYFPLGGFMVVPMIAPIFQMVNTSDDVEYRAKIAISDAGPEGQCHRLMLSASLVARRKGSSRQEEGGIRRQSQEEEVVEGKVRDKLNNMVLVDQETYDKLYKEVITYNVSERLKVRASLAKAGLRELQAKGLVKCIVHHGGQIVYTRAT